MNPAVRIRYETIEFGDEDIHVRTLRDKQEYEDIDGEAEAHGISSASWSLFGVVWESSKALAHLMFEYDIGDRTVLEVGCGIGLASLILSRRGCRISATDRHPEAERYLRENCELNGEAEIPFFRVGWDEPAAALGRYDLVIGSDLLYEPDHAKLLAGFLDQVADVSSEVIIADPGRGNSASHAREMATFGFERSAADQTPPGVGSVSFLRYLR